MLMGRQQGEGGRNGRDGCVGGVEWVGWGGVGGLQAVRCVAVCGADKKQDSSLEDPLAACRGGGGRG